MNEADFERAVVEEAVAGDAGAKRQLLSLGVDALRRGVPMSAELRSFLADGLLQVQCAVDPGPGQVLKPEVALKAFGFEKNPRHRKANSSTGELTDRGLEILAAVHLLTKAVGGDGQSKVVSLIAAAIPVSERTVWRSIQNSSWTGDDAVAAQVAAPLLVRAAREAQKYPLSHCQELRDFLSVTRDT